MSKFKYLGQWITQDGRSDLEVKSRIQIARDGFMKMRDVFASRSLDLELRKRMVRCYVLSTFMYAAESWTLSKELEDSGFIAECCAFRIHIMRTNVRVFEMVKETPRLLRMVKDRKLRYFGHIVRANGKQRHLWRVKLRESEGVESLGKPGRWTLQIGAR